MTIYDIAKEAGVSASTVSRVVNGKKGIKPETRNKITELLKKHDYTPNEVARGLVNRSTKTIGILLEDIRNTHHTEMAYIIERTLKEFGYCSLFLNTGVDELEKIENIKRLAKRQVDGVIMIGSMFQLDCVKAAILEHLNNIPIVITNGYLDLDSVYSVIVDEMSGVENCVNLLATRGHSSTAFIQSNQTNSNDEKRKGFINGMIHQGKLPENLIIRSSNGDIQDGYNCTKEVMEQNPTIDSIIYSEDLLAVGGIRALIDMNYKIPKDIAVIGINNSKYAEICYPKLSSLDNMHRDMSITASRILMDALNKSYNPRKIMLFSKLVEREST